MFIEVGFKSCREDAIGRSVRRGIAEDLGIKVEEVLYLDVYEFRRGLGDADAKKAAELLFTDAITQSYSIGKPLHTDFDWEITVRFNEDVTDNVGHTAVEAVNDLLGTRLERDSIRTARKYVIKGKLSEQDVGRICRGMLANQLIESFKYSRGK